MKYCCVGPDLGNTYIANNVFRIITIENCEEKQDSGKLWKNVLCWLNWSTTSSPTRLLSQGQLVSSPNKMANIQNEYYVQKVLNIRNNLPQPKIDPLSTLRQKMQGVGTVFSLSVVTPAEVEKIIGNLKNSKASGPCLQVIPLHHYSHVANV